MNFFFRAVTATISAALLLLSPSPYVLAAAAQVPQKAVGGAQCEKTAGYDAIIVGAGLAGLSAAKELVHLKHSVLILEANDRIGGRAWVGQISVGTGGTQKVPIDYGGAWLHGVPTNPLTGLVDSLGFQRARSELDVPYRVDGEAANAQQLKLFEGALEQYETATERATKASEHEFELAQEACGTAEKIAENETTPQELCTRLTAAMPDKAAAKRLCAAARRIPQRGSAKGFCS